MNDVIDLEPVKSREVAAAPAATPYQLIAQAIDKGLPIEQMERLFALQERWEANEAKKAYTVAFGAFKAEAVKLLRNKGVTAGPLVGKRYAELHAVNDVLVPALARHGLSASWKLTKDEKDWMEVTCILSHTGGHSEAVSMGGPPDAGGAKNPIQARASTMTYLERYTLKAVTGTAEAGQDDDGGAGAGAQTEGGADPDAALRTEGQDAAMSGMEALTAWWGKLDAKQRGRLTKDFAAWRRCAAQVPK